MIDISKYPVWVTHKEERKSFFDILDAGKEAEFCMSMSAQEDNTFKLQREDLKDICDSDITPSACTEDVDKTCDFYMSRNLKGPMGQSLMYACYICKMRKNGLSLVEGWESGEFSSRTAEDAEIDKKMIESLSPMCLEDFEVKDFCDRIDAVINQRTVQ